MRVGKADGETWLRLSEAADQLGVSLNTLRRWSDAGKLTCYRSPGGHRRYRRSDVETLLRGQTGDGRRGEPPAPSGGRPDVSGAAVRLHAPLLAFAQVATEGIGLTAGSFLLALGDEGLEVVAEYDRDETRQRATERITLDDAPLAAEVLRTGRRLIIADLSSTNVLEEGPAAACRSRGDTAVLAVPLALQGRCVGVLELAERRGPRTFSGANVAFAEFLARQAAGLLSAELGGATAPAEQRPLGPGAPAEAPAARDASWREPSDTRALLRSLAARLRGEVGAVACDVLSYDRVEQTLALLAAGHDAEGEPQMEGLAFHADGPGIDELLAGGGAVTVAELDRPELADTHLARHGGAGSVLCAPLRRGHDTVGLLEVFSATSEHDFSREERGLIDAAATLAAMAIAESDTGARLTRRVAKLDELIAGFTAHAPTSDAATVARSALQVVRETTGATVCSLYQIEEGVATLVETSAEAGIEPGSTDEWRLEEYPPAASAAADRTLVTVTGADDPQLTTEAAARFLEGRGLAGVVLAPVQFVDRLVGLVEAGAGDASRLPVAAEVTGALAPLLGVALGGGDVLADLQRRNRDLALVVEAGLEDMARLNTDEVLHAVAQRLSDLTHKPVVDVYAVEGEALRALVSYDGGRFDLEWEDVVIPLSRYPNSRKAVETGEISLVSSLEDPTLAADARYSLEKWGYQGQLSMPLVSSGRVIGLVELSDYSPCDFGLDLELIRGLGQVAAHALENASLFEQLERRSGVLNELVDLGRLASRTRDLTTLLRAVAERLLTTVDAANCDIYQVSGDALRCAVSYDRSGHDEGPVGSLLDLETYPTVTAAMNAHQVLVIASPDDAQLTERERETYRENGFASEVCIPVLVNEALFGVIDIYDTRERDYADHLSFLTSAGQTLAGAFENALLFTQLEHRSNVLREVVELGALTSQTRDLRGVLATLAARLRDTVEAADCDIFTLHGDRLRCMVSADLHGFDDSVVGHQLDMDKFPATAMAIRTGEVMTVASLDDPRLTSEERDDYAEYGFQSELCIPLVVGERVIGLIDVFDTRPRDYTEYLDYIRSVGQIAAGAVENALLVDELERRNRALAELVELGKLVSGAGGLRRLVRAVGPKVVDVMHADGCQVFNVRGDRLECLLTFENGDYQDDYVGRPLDLDLFPSTRTALERRETLVISSPDDPRLSDYERGLCEESGSRSEICLPLAVDDRVVGLLDVYDRRERDYAEHRDFLASVGQIVAGAFENALLLEQLEETNQMLTSLVDAGLEFGATLDLGQVLRSVARRLCATTAAANCDIYTVADGVLTCVACIDHGQPDEQFVGSTYGIEQLPTIRLALDAGQAVTVTDLASDPRLSDFERREDMGWGHRAKLELPLISRGSAIGIAAVYDDHTRDFEHLDLLQSLAQVAANALANATVFERLDRSAERMALVGEVSYELSSSLDLDEVLLSTARRLCAVADVPSCDIYTLHDGERLTNVVSIADGEVDLSWQGRSFPLEGWAIAALAVESRQPVLAETRDDPRLLPAERAVMEEFGETGELSVPLICKDRVIGVLELLENRGRCNLTDEQTATIFALSRVAALAIDNADLFEDLQLRSSENELLNDIARATGASLEIADIAGSAVEKLRELMSFDRALLALRRDDTTFDIAYSTSARPQMLPDSVPVPRVGDFFARLARERVLVLHLPADVPQGFQLPGLESLRAAVLIALNAGDELIGVLSLGAEDASVFAAVDRHLLERVGTQLALAINNASLYADIKRLHVSNLKALSSALNAKDYYTLGHAARVAAYMVLLGDELGWPKDLLRQVEEAAYLHDIGKIGVSDRVLLKPSGLNSKEWELMRQHPIFSADIIKALFDEALTLGVRHHHEHWGGDGYPDGLSGEDIPLVARAMCVVDSYDAMSFRRPYRQALTYEECRAELERCSGTQFDPAMVEAFGRVLDRMAAGHDHAQAAAAEAAARIDAKTHALLRTPEDAGRPEYQEIVNILREVRDAHPPTQYVTTHAKHGKTIVFVADSGGDEDAANPRIGDEAYADDELLMVFAGEEPFATVLYVDQWGVWLSGTAPVLDADGNVAAVVSADVPAMLDGAEIETLRSDVAQTFASMLDAAAVQAGRSEIEAITDSLTGLYNHRYFHERLDEEMERCQESGAQLSLLFCDVDDFRTFNQVHGHSAGDRALRRIARVIESSLRHIDMAARYGGEEFAAILIDTSTEGALEVAERIRTGILATEFGGSADGLSISIGVASCPADATFKDELVDKTDWAMFLAKRRGRNKVMTFSAGHGGDTPEQSVAVASEHVAAMSELVETREAYARQRREAIGRLAVSVGREVGLKTRELKVLSRGGAHGGEKPTEVAQKVLTLATTYQELVTGRPYRPRISEIEALEELLACPALLYDRDLAAAFERVLSRRSDA